MGYCIYPGCVNVWFMFQTSCCVLVKGSRFAAAWVVIPHGRCAIVWGVLGGVPGLLISVAYVGDNVFDYLPATLWFWVSTSVVVKSPMDNEGRC